MSAAGVAAGAGIVGTGVQVGSSLFDTSKSDAASAKADAAQKQADASFINAQRDVLDAVRIQNESDMESEYTAFTYDREAQWVEAWTPVELAYGKLFANQEKLSAIQDASTSAKLSVDLALTQVGNLFKTALTEADIANATAEAKAKYTEAKGEGQVRELQSERDFQLGQLRDEAVQQQGELAAKIAAQGREMTGSALEVMQQQDDINAKKVSYLKLKAGSQIADVDFQTGYDAATTRQTGHIQAQEVVTDAMNKGESLLQEAQIKNDAYQQQLDTKLNAIDTKLEYNTLVTQTESERTADQYREQGWRTVWKLDQSTQDTIWGLQYDIMDQVTGGTSSANAAEKYSSQADSTDWGSLAKAGSSLLGGVTSVYNSGVKAKWWS
ncbi:hypothetical protein [Solidesulfovibrio sp.]|uniref:hypothetical protein n=1 Tax=Solidesulfovibrio sp. TaxID=2910990 RepID=UPI00262F59F3|nr:hypothetical protein [Solidesulfovibrio sp.]